MQRSKITWMILINIWVLLGHTLILEFSLHCLFPNFPYQSPFFFLQIVPILGAHFIVAWFLTLFLDFSLGKRVHYVPLGSLKCSRLGPRTLSWEQNRSLKKRERKCTSFRSCFWLGWHTVSLKIPLLGARSLKGELYSVIRGCVSLFSEQMLPGMWGLTDQDVSPSLSLHPLLYLTSPVVDKKGLLSRGFCIFLEFIFDLNHINTNK